MRYLLSSQYALRSWRLIPYAYYTRHEPYAQGLTQAEFELLEKCDGRTELPETPLLCALIEKGMISLCEGPDEALTDWQRPMACDNRYFPAMNWMITGKCNYNCRHCFNAVDNAPLMSEWTMEEADRLLDEAKRCGINSFTLTGGEPMLHPHFMDIVAGIHRRGMYVEELNTNGAFITREILRRFKALGCGPLMKISFDGVGYHDWMRMHKGAEQRALQAMRLCAEEGFAVMAQVNVNRVNLQSMPKTLNLLESMGVQTARIIRTTESPRWAANAGDSALTLTEYLDAMLALVQAYVSGEHEMNLRVWQMLNIMPRERMYEITPVAFAQDSYRDSAPVCHHNRGMVAVAAGGNVFPCHQMSGYYEQHGMHLGNVKTAGLQPILQDGAYLCEVSHTVREVRAHDPQCAACPYFRHCAGGCRAIALMSTGDKLARDPWKCQFFQSGYVKKIEAIMAGYKNLTPMK